MLQKPDLDLLRQQYATDDSWRVRVETHEQYSDPAVDFVQWTMDLMPWQGTERVLDVGSGTGRYFDYLRQKYPNLDYLGVDYSHGIVKKHLAEGLVARGAVEMLPFEDNSFDVVMANHMLYLAPDVEKAISECRRVLKREGVFIAATNSIHTQPQFRELFRRAILLVSPPGAARDVRQPQPLHNRFSLENGTTLLGRQFFAVVRHDLPSRFVFDDPEPIIDYLESLRAVREPQLPDGVNWDTVMLIMRDQVTKLIENLQTLEVDKITGVLMATDSGGFIHDFVSKKAPGSSFIP